MLGRTSGIVVVFFGVVAHPRIKGDKQMDKGDRVYLCYVYHAVSDASLLL